MRNESMDEVLTEFHARDVYKRQGSLSWLLVTLNGYCIRLHRPSLRPHPCQRLSSSISLGLRLGTPTTLPNLPQILPDLHTAYCITNRLLRTVWRLCWVGNKSVRSVSYTHLDVYKRQFQRSVMSIEKAAEAILAEGQRTGRMARPTGEFPACEKADKEASLAFAHAALPHLLEEPTEREISEVYDATHTCPTPVGMSMSQVTYALRKFVSIRRNAPPEPPEPSHVVEPVSYTHLDVYKRQDCRGRPQ